MNIHYDICYQWYFLLSSKQNCQCSWFKCEFCSQFILLQQASDHQNHCQGLKKILQQEEQPSVYCQQCSQIVGQSQFADHQFAHTIQANNLDFEIEDGLAPNFQTVIERPPPVPFLPPDLEQKLYRGRIKRLQQQQRRGPICIVNSSRNRNNRRNFRNQDEEGFIRQRQYLEEIRRLYQIMEQTGEDRVEPQRRSRNRNVDLPCSRFQGGSKEDCVVCLNEIQNGEKVSVLACAHMFHIKCIQDWVKQNPDCPICRNPI